MPRLLIRLVLNAVSLTALIVILSNVELVAEVAINCDKGDGFYDRSAPIERTFTCRK